MWRCRRRVERRADRAAAAALKGPGGVLLAETIDNIFQWRPTREKNAWVRSRRLQRTTLTIQGVSVNVYIDTQLNYAMWSELDFALTRGQLSIDDPPCKQLTFAAQNTPWEE